MSQAKPTHAEIAEWAFAALCPDEDKRAKAVRNLTFALYRQEEEINNLRSRLEAFALRPTLTKIYGGLK